MIRHLLLAAAVFFSASCNSPNMRTGEPATPLDELAGALDSGNGRGATAGRVQTMTIEGVTVSAAILPDAPARRRYGVNLAGKGIQAVWLRVANAVPQENWLLMADLDPDYYTADEAAYRFRRIWQGGGFEKRQQRFRDLAMRSRLEAGKTYEGHVLIPRTEGGRFVSVTLNGHGKVRRFGFPLRTPDGHFDYEKTNADTVYDGQKLPDLTRAQLRAKLETLPPATVNAKGTGSGDPLNLVLVGDASRIMSTLSECGWSFSHRIDWHTVRKEIAAALKGKPYLTAPLSSLYLFGRSQDLAFQRSRSNLSQRNHMRLWLAPYTHAGRPVWVGQVSRDIGIKLTRKSPTLTTHLIDPAVDEARQFVLESLLNRLRLQAFGFVRASPPAPRSHPRRNLGGDPYITDGLRLVLLLAANPVPPEKVQNLNWTQTTQGPIEFEQSMPAANPVN